MADKRQNSSLHRGPESRKLRRSLLSRSCFAGNGSSAGKGQQRTHRFRAVAALVADAASAVAVAVAVAGSRAMSGLLPDTDSEDELPVGWRESVAPNGQVVYTK